MKVALVHDYIKEYGGAERVLSVLHEIYPEAPIYCAFYKPGSSAAKAFSDACIKPSWANILIRNWNLYSPLRFLTPLIWESFDFSSYDLVILSSSWFVTKPVRIPKNVRVICYCHTPPRSLYGYATGMEWQRYLLVKIYFYIVSHFLRIYDFMGAQRVDEFIVNSKNVAGRVKKFYRRDSTVIYPPVEVVKIKNETRNIKKEDFFLIAGRIAGAKGIDVAMEAANKLGVKLKVVGEFSGMKFGRQDLEKHKSENIDFLGRVSDSELYKLYGQAKAFLALGQDEDFGITPVEAMAAGTPVVAFKSGGYLETVVEGKTGVFFEEYNAKKLSEAMEKISKMKFKKEDLYKQAAKFSKEKFIENMKGVVGA